MRTLLASIAACLLGSTLVAVLPVSASAAPPLNPLACRAVHDGGIKVGETTSTPLVSCTIAAPSAGKVLVMASASAARDTTDVEARYQLAVNGTPSIATDRWVNVTADATDGTDRSVAVSQLVDVGAGNHSFSLNTLRYAGTGNVQSYDPTIWAVFIPDGSPYATCAAQGNAIFDTVDPAFTTVRSCNLNVTQPSRVLVLATASAGYLNADSEGRLRVGVDNAIGHAASDRWFNVYADGGDGTDRSVATQYAAPVAAGSHTITLSASRYSGTGTSRLYDASLVAIAVPTASTGLQLCSSTTGATWTNADTSYTNLATCDITAPEAGTALVVGTGSGGIDDGGTAWEGQFRLGTTNVGSAQSDRWVNTVTDAADGDDVAVAASYGTPVPAGPRTFYFVGRRYAGTGTLRVYNPAVAALFVPDPDLTAPTVTVTSAPVDGTTERSATITFSVDADSTTTCRLDTGAATSCASTFAVSDLAVGPHTVTITATDDVGNSSTTSVSWTVADVPVPLPTPAPTPPTPTPTPTPPAPEAGLSGTKVRLDAFVTRRSPGRACPSRAAVTVLKGRTALVARSLKARPVTSTAGVRGCRVRGTVTLPAKPQASARLKVRITGKNLRTRTLRVVRL